MNYNLIERYRELEKQYKKTKDKDLLMEIYSLDHYFECETYKTYGDILKKVMDTEKTKVVDIGCGFGHQSDVFMKKGIDYSGIERSNLNFFNKDSFEYFVGEYPKDFMERNFKDSIGISVLFIGWECYFFEEDTFKEQIKALENHFDEIILYIKREHAEIVQKTFPKREMIRENLYYFSKEEI